MNGNIDSKENTAKKAPSLALSLVPVAVLIVFLFCGITFLGASPHIPMLAAAIATVLVAMLVLKYSWDEIMEGILASINSAMPAILILMTVGMVIGTWVSSGVVPTMIYYGLKIINPSFFLITSMLICSVVSLSIGSSWTVAATVGVALMGTGTSMGIPVPVIAGSIISGAYFGDKMSPLSDTTNLAPGIIGVPLMDHVKHMFFTTAPSYVISLVLFGIINMQYGASATNQEAIGLLSTHLSDQFHITPLLLFVPVIVIVLVILKVPAFLALFAGSLLGGVFAAIFQGDGLGAIIDAMHYGYFSETGYEPVDELLTRGGLDSMMWTVSLILIAMVFSGVMERTGMIATLTGAMLRFTRSTGSLVLTTILCAIGINFLTGEQYLSIVVPDRMFKASYEEKGLDLKNLSRVVEDAGTITSPLIPWNGCGAFMIATLGLTPWTYVPFCFLNILNPIISAIYGFTGISMAKAKPVEKSVQGG